MKTSAGILLYKIKNKEAQVLLAHMGGPFWARKDNGAWSVIKGEFDPAAEEPLTAAKREFKEETSCPAPNVEYFALKEIKTSGKIIHVFAGNRDFDVSKIKSNTFEIEWPPKSGQMQTFPEIDRAAWFDLPTAKEKLVKSQAIMIDELEKYLRKRFPDDALHWNFEGNNSIQASEQQTLF
ncbi:NUDIX domain-containing protein [Candidatus Saccharibacteria bacterium]|nr:NUDIX domain-containing protein [Candidatus Saccharibacteria bacterium]